MFVECKSNNGFEDQLTTELMYKVISLGENSYQILNDKGDVSYYGTMHFVINKVNL